LIELVGERVARVVDVDPREAAERQTLALRLVVGLGPQVERLFHVRECGGLQRQLG
jgi:hypothetical protein